MKELEAGFAEIEKRLTNLVADNAVLKKRVAELERELARARAESGELRKFQEKRQQIRGKIEKVLRSLESIDETGPEERT